MRVAMSSTREIGIVPFSTNAVRFGPHHDVSEPSVMSPGIDICTPAGGGGTAGGGAERRRRERRRRRHAIGESGMSIEEAGVAVAMAAG